MSKGDKSIVGWADCGCVSIILSLSHARNKDLADFYREADKRGLRVETLASEKMRNREWQCPKHKAEMQKRLAEKAKKQRPLSAILSTVHQAESLAVGEADDPHAISVARSAVRSVMHELVGRVDKSKVYDGLMDASNGLHGHADVDDMRAGFALAESELGRLVAAEVQTNG